MSDDSPAGQWLRMRLPGIPRREGLSSDGFTATCHLCEWQDWAASEEVAKAESVWHVYREHPQRWRSLIGTRQPREPDPHTAHGRQQLRAEES